MKDNISEWELNLIKSEAVLKCCESMGIKFEVLDVLTNKVRKAIEDEKEIRKIEVAHPKPRKSWQENVWLYLIMGIIIGLIVGLLLKYVF